MTVTPAPSSAALLILRQANLSAATPQPSSSLGTDTLGNDILATANGVASAEGSEGAGATQAARAKISEALFNPQVPDVTQMKINLMRRLGEEFGLDLDKFESQGAFGAAIERAVGALKLQGGPLALREIEQKLGLDRLGISLDTLVNAIIDPEGSDGQKLTAALRKELGEDVASATRTGAAGTMPPGRTGEDGLYDVRG